MDMHSPVGHRWSDAPTRHLRVGAPHRVVRGWDIPQLDGRHDREKHQSRVAFSSTVRSRKALSCKVW